MYNEPCSTCQRGSAKENLLGSAKLSASNEVCARNKKKEKERKYKENGGAGATIVCQTIKSHGFRLSPPALGTCEGGMFLILLQVHRPRFVWAQRLRNDPFRCLRSAHFARISSAAPPAATISNQQESRSKNRSSSSSSSAFVDGY